MTEPLESADYQFFIGMASELVEPVIESDRLHVPRPHDVRLYDERMKPSCGDFQGDRLSLAYNADGFITAAWVG